MPPIICLAPLRGLTDAIFRSVYARCFHGIDCAVTPFLTTVQGSRIKPSHIKEVLPQNNRGMSIVPQILSKRPDDFINLARVLFDYGHALLNWNLGCPYPMVARKQRGSGLLPHPDMIDSFLEQVLAAIPNRLSIKLRLGRFDRREIFALLPIFARYPLEELIIHPRLGVQMYDGTPDLDTFAECLERTSQRVVYNGDIVSRESFDYLQSRFPGISRWMIGRGVLIDPFLPAVIKGAQRADSARQVLRRFHDTLIAEYAKVLHSRHLVDKMKGFWSYLTLSFPDSAGMRKMVHKTTSLEGYRCAVEKIFRQNHNDF